MAVISLTSDRVIDLALHRAACAAAAFQAEVVHVDPEVVPIVDSTLTLIEEVRAGLPLLRVPHGQTATPLRLEDLFKKRLRVLHCAHKLTLGFRNFIDRVAVIRKTSLPAHHRTGILALAEELGVLLADRMFESLEPKLVKETES